MYSASQVRLAATLVLLLTRQGFKVSNATTFTEVGKFTPVIESGQMALQNDARTVRPMSCAYSAAAVGCSFICYVDTVHSCITEKLFLQ